MWLVRSHKRGNKGSGKYKEGNGSTLCPRKVAVFSKWIHFFFFFFLFCQDFHSRKGFERAREVRKKEKKWETRDEGGEESASYETTLASTRARARHPPIYITHPAPEPLFLRIFLLSSSVFHCLFAGLCSPPKSWRWYIKSISDLISVKTKISMLLTPRDFCVALLLLMSMKCRYNGALCAHRRLLLYSR